VRTRLPADGAAATVLNVTVVDKNGKEVPDAVQKIRFSVEGDGAILGVGNGDPSSHEPDYCADGDWSRSLFGGRAQVIVRAGLTKGTILFRAEGHGLQAAEVRLTAE
ncbi:MAG TPA: hypothetical protein VGM89_11220, partial [Puia sp.]|jgi:beta-galactosidase